MTTTPNTYITVTLLLDQLDAGGARFASYVRAEPFDAGAEGFGVAGGVQIARTIDREAWEGLGSPVALPVTLHALTPAPAELQA